MRLDQGVANRFGLSRRGAREAVRRGQVDVAGQVCLEPGREIDSETPLSYSPERPRPEIAARRLRVLYEDEHILIVDKPAGVLTQPTEERERDTLLERAGRYVMRSRGVKRPYTGIVHRIDRDTSGVVLLVCSPSALRPFQALFRAHSIERSYVAVAEGEIAPARGTISRPLVADRGDGRRGTARRPGEGLRAITHYESIERFGGVATRLLCRLETGRTHQIRVHLAEAGHPLVGERVYRSKTRPPFPLPFSRQALHAHALGFVHPISGKAMHVEAPLPEDITNLIAGLRDRYGGRTGSRD
jgi:23S rRNA pseudouridine1911/1915/1917 synthase